MCPWSWSRSEGEAAGGGGGEGPEVRGGTPHAHVPMQSPVHFGIQEQYLMK